MKTKNQEIVEMFEYDGYSIMESYPEHNIIIMGVRTPAGTFPADRWRDHVTIMDGVWVNGLLDIDAFVAKNKKK